MGEMGLSVEEFYNMTPRQFHNKRDGFHRQLEYKTQLMWEVTRWQAAVNIAPHTKKRLGPRDLVQFPWDAKRSNKVHRAASFEEVQEAVKKMFG